MEKKWYAISFSAKLSEDDLIAMQDVFYDAISESMGITELASLSIVLDGNQDD